MQPQPPGPPDPPSEPPGPPLGPPPGPPPDVPFGPPPGPPPVRRLTWLWIVLGAVALLLVVCGVGAALAIPAVRSRLAATSPSATSGRTPGASVSVSAGAGTGTACEYTAAPEDAPADHKAPMPPAQATTTGKVRVSLPTNQGELTLELNADDAPCTVNSFLSLARNGYYDNSPCHRLTTSSIYVLQCGDPGGTGTGGPGYRFSDENLPTGQSPAYPRGTVAMANAGPATNGSQFFLVYKDSEIDPNYTVFGTITGGLDVLDKIAGSGAADDNGPGDGRPKLAVTIRTAKIR